MFRGIDRGWLRDLYRFAPAPHGVLYLKIGVPQLVPRVVARGVFDYWESGMDFQEEADFFRSFTRYQTRLLTVFEELASEYQFRTIDAGRGVAEVFRDIKEGVAQLVSDMKGARR